MRGMPRTCRHDRKPMASIAAIGCRTSKVWRSRDSVGGRADRGLAEQGESQAHGWDRARLGVVVPLCVVVAVAIVCIVVAALTSAHRADEVALEHEKQLLTRAIANHGEWSLRQLESVIATDEAVRRDPRPVRSRLGPAAASASGSRPISTTISSWWPTPPTGSSTPARTQQRRSALVQRASCPSCSRLIDYLRGRSARCPTGAIRIVGAATRRRRTVPRAPR